MSGESAEERIDRILKKQHNPVTANTLVTPVEKDAAGNPLGSTSAKNHETVINLGERARLIRALNLQAQLSAEDMELARRLGIELGPQRKDQTEFDL